MGVRHGGSADDVHSMDAFDFTRPPVIDDDARTRELQRLGLGAERAALTFTSLLRRTVRARATPRDDLVVRPPNVRWFTYSDHACPVRIGMGDPELTGLAEVFMGAPGGKPERAATALELRVLLPRLTQVLESLHEASCTRRGDGGRLEEIDPDTIDREVDDTSWLELLFVLDGVEFPMFLPLASRVAVATSVPGRADGIVGEVPLELDIALRPTLLSAAEVATLAVGDVLRTGHPTALPFVGRIDGRRILTAQFHPGTRMLSVDVVSLAGEEIEQ
jgi:hypothetical protein